jgi:DNA invertase Pin-like site-specific DNA recombinase
MEKYISYYRVSTQRQNISGLGLEAQKSEVNNFLRSTDSLICEYQEAESGKNNHRPQLLKAIMHCKEVDATLLIAKLDRLSRNAAFIFTLKDSNVKFKCVDMPEANSLTIGIMAVLAQEEREMISLRTKKALHELKKKGVTLGSPQNLTDKARKKGTATIKRNALRNENNRRATSVIVLLRNEKSSFQKIADKLNEDGFKTRRGCSFQPAQVWELYKRHQEQN